MSLSLLNDSLIDMNKPTSLSIWAGANGMESLADFSFVLWMTSDRSKFGSSVSELALEAITAGSSFFERSTEFRLVKALRS